MLLRGANSAFWWAGNSLLLLEFFTWNNVAKKILPNFGSSEAANKSDGFWYKNKIETYQSKQEKQHDPIQTMSTRDANHLQTYKPQDLCKKCLGSQAGLSM